MSYGQNPTGAQEPSPPRLLPFSASLMQQENAPYGYWGAPMYQPIALAQASGPKPPQDLTKRRVSEARRQRTPMSCDRCKVRKIKCVNPTPGPCVYCSRMKFHCQITAQRKHRPLYFTSDEQFQWMIAILQHFVPGINLELEGLKTLGAQLGVVGPAPPPPAQTPIRTLPTGLELAYGQPTESISNPSEHMSERSHSPPGEVDREDNEGRMPGIDDLDTLTLANTGTLHLSSPNVAQDLQQSVYTQSSQPTVPNDLMVAKTSSTLPTREVADRYVENYFNNLNELFWVLSYNEFMTWYQGYDPAKPLGPTREAVLLLVLAFGSSSESSDEREKYISSALNLVGDVMKQGGLDGIQALLLMSLYSMFETRGYGIWTFAGSAIRIAQCMNLLQDNECQQQEDQDTRRRVWWSLYDLERFIASHLSLSSSIVDDSVNISLPIDKISLETWSASKTSGENIRISPPGYNACSVSLSQILGRAATYLSLPNISLYTLLHYFSELQDWSDTLPEPFRHETFKQNQAHPFNTKYTQFLALRWRDAVMVVMKPFLASLARFGSHPLPHKLSSFFQFCAHAAAVAARETLDMMKYIEQNPGLNSLSVFSRHFLLQSAGVLALSAVVQQGGKDERASYNECIEMLLRLPRSVDEDLIREMRVVNDKLERFAAGRAVKDALGSFYTPMPSLSFKQLAFQFGATGISEKNEENLARWIPRRVIWDDVSDCITVGLKREGCRE